MTVITPPIGVPNPWERPFVDVKPPVSERLVRALEAHIAAEADDAALCDRVAEASTDDAARLLMELIREDTRRHRSLLERMVRRLHQESDFEESPTALAVPTDDAAVSEEYAQLLRTLIRDAQEGGRYLRHLARQDSELYSGFFALLLETFARDNEKHVHLLRYVLRHAEAR